MKLKLKLKSSSSNACTCPLAKKNQLGTSKGPPSSTRTQLIIVIDYAVLLFTEKWHRWSVLPSVRINRFVVSLLSAIRSGVWNELADMFISWRLCVACKNRGPSEVKVTISTPSPPILCQEIRHTWTLWNKMADMFIRWSSFIGLIKKNSAFVYTRMSCLYIQYNLH